MSTKIEWTGKTWNPIRARNKANGNFGHMCEKVSAGCKNCYAERMQTWPFNNPIRYGAGDRDKVNLLLDLDALMQPASWKKPTYIFPCSMTDLFYEQHPFEMIDAVFRVMADCDQHIYQVLTKRPHIAEKFQSWKSQNAGAAWHFPDNAWMGTSVEDQPAADLRIPSLLRLRAKILWLSCEPLLGPVDLFKVAAPKDPEQPNEKYFFDALTVNGGYEWEYEEGLFDAVDGPTHPGIDWIVAGGESGRLARPMHPDWARSLRDQCADADVAFFFKQWGEWGIWDGDIGKFASLHFWPDDDPTRTIMSRVGKKAAGRLLDGVEHSAMPGVNSLAL